MSCQFTNLGLEIKFPCFFSKNSLCFFHCSSQLLHVSFKFFFIEVLLFNKINKKNYFFVH